MKREEAGEGSRWAGCGSHCAVEEDKRVAELASVSRSLAS